jgi:DNA-binding transcriptional MerR regulator
MSGLTVRELAERVRDPDEDLDVVVNRLRSWTKEGLLDPEGERNPGTGRKRLYPETAVIDAMALNLLTERAGMPSTQAFKLLWKTSKEDFFRTPPKVKKFLVISKGPKDLAVSTCNVDSLASHLSPKKYDVHIVVDYNQLFERAQESPANG